MSSISSGGKVQVHIDKGGEWAFSADCHPKAYDFAMVCLEEEFPLSVGEVEAPTELTVALKCQLYKEIHGYFGVKEPLMRKLTAIAERVPKSALDGLLRETTTKIGNQRLVRPEIIEFLSENQEGFANELAEIRAMREGEWEEERRGRVTEKERQI